MRFFLLFRFSYYRAYSSYLSCYTLSFYFQFIQSLGFPRLPSCPTRRHSFSSPHLKRERPLRGAHLYPNTYRDVWEESRTKWPRFHGKVDTGIDPDVLAHFHLWILEERVWLWVSGGRRTRGNEVRWRGSSEYASMLVRVLCESSPFLDPLPRYSSSFFTSYLWHPLIVRREVVIYP